MTHRMIEKIATLTAVLAMAACGGSGSAGSPSPTASVRLSSFAKIEILSPTSATVVRGTSTQVEVRVTGARVLLGAATTDVRPDTGHVHLLLDGQTVTQFAGLRYDLTNLKPGKHVLIAEFSAADHGPFNPRVTDQVVFAVR